MTKKRTLNFKSVFINQREFLLTPVEIEHLLHQLGYGKVGRAKILISMYDHIEAYLKGGDIKEMNEGMRKEMNLV